MMSPSITQEQTRWPMDSAALGTLHAKGTSGGARDAGDGDPELTFGQRIIFCHFVSLWGTF
jgi:hypothetical protein